MKSAAQIRNDRIKNFAKMLCVEAQLEKDEIKVSEVVIASDRCFSVQVFSTDKIDSIAHCGSEYYTSERRGVVLIFKSKRKTTDDQKYNKQAAIL